MYDIIGEVISISGLEVKRNFSLTNKFLFKTISFSKKERRELQRLRRVSQLKKENKLLNFLYEEFPFDDFDNFEIRNKLIHLNDNLILEDLPRLYSLGYSFDPEAFSENPNISLEIVKKYPEIEWNTNVLFKNPNFFPEDLKPLKRCEWDYFSENPNLQEEFLFKNINKPWDWNKLGNHLDPEFILKSKDLPWSRDWIYFNPKVKLEVALQQKNIDIVRFIKQNENVTWEEYLSFPQLLDIFEEVKSEIKDVPREHRKNFNIHMTNLTIEDLNKCFHENIYGREVLTRNPSFSFEMIKEYHEFPWLYEAISFQKIYG